MSRVAPVATSSNDLRFGPYAAHAATEWFPMMDEDALAQLADDIRKNGQLEPCVIWGDIMVDGRNRWLACQRAAIDPAVSAREFEDDAACVRWILAENFQRRNLTASQRAMVAVQSRAFFEDEVRRRMLSDPTDDRRHGGPDQVTEVVGALRNDARSALHSSASNEWYTPAPYIDAAREVLGAIDLDPASCAAANQVVGARMFYDATTNGLDQPRSGRVFMNPPYGKDGGTSNQRAWSRKLIGAFESDAVEEAIMLVNAATDTSWFQPLWDYSICFVSHRIRFLPADGTTPNSPTHASAFVYLGSNIDAFRRAFARFGRITIPRGDGIETCPRETPDSPG